MIASARQRARRALRRLSLTPSQARTASNSLPGSPPKRNMLSATARYSIPVSMCGRSKCLASARAMVPLPLAAGPSTAMTMGLEGRFM